MLDTSVVIDIFAIEEDELPTEASIAALTLAELTSGPLSTKSPAARAERLERLQWVEATFEAIPFDVAAARAYGSIYVATVAAKQKARGARSGSSYRGHGAHENSRSTRATRRIS